ncbi:MAG: ABC transporter permease [Streptosporangiaceae bacterium]|nr:ABC transporter permease [Streptosporangiaceae bacterium]
MNQTARTGPAETGCFPGRQAAWRRGELAAVLHRELRLLTRDRTNLLLAVVPTGAYIMLFATSLAHLLPGVSYHGRIIGYPEFVVPGLLFSSLLAASTTAGTALFQERLGNMTLELSSYPSRRSFFIAGKLIAGSALVLAQTLAALIVSALVLPVHWSAGQWAALLTGVMATAPAFNCLYLLLAASVRDFQRFMVLVNVLTPILLFASPAFYPADRMAASVRWLQFVNPVTYGVGVLRDSVLFGLSSDWLPLAAFAAVAAGAGALVSQALRRQSRDL